MATPSMIWVLIRATEARNTFLSFVDSGNYKEAIDQKFRLEGMVNQLKSFVQQHGAGCPIACEDVVAMKIPVTLGRQLESIMKLYLKEIPGIACGVGFNYSEAATACKLSRKTRKIELYSKQNGEDLNRSEDPEIHKLTDVNVSLPTNLFDPTSPSDSQYLDQLKEPKIVGMPGFEAEMQAESAYVKLLATQMGSPSDQEIQQAQAQQQQAQQQAQAGAVDQSQNPNAKSMLSALGKNPPKPNDKDEDGEDKEDEGKSLRDAKSSKKDSDKSDDDEKSSKKDKEDDDSSKDDDSDDDSDDPEDMDQKELEAKIKSAETEAKDDHNQKLFDQLDRIKSDLPQIMGLAQKDPKAFKQSMTMVGKLLDVAKKVRKGEIDLADAETLEKTRIELNLPVGSRKGAKKKVSVAGKPDAWRSMRTGQLKDEDDGSPISVREHNVKMKQKTNNGL